MAESSGQLGCKDDVRQLQGPKLDTSSPDRSAARVDLAVGVRVLVTRGHSKGERGVITNSPGRFFTGWTVKLDNGRLFGAGAWELRAES